MEGKQYMARLQILKADTLDIRRLKLDLVLFYKIIHNMTKLPTEKFFTLRKVTSGTRGHSLTIYKPCCSNNLARYSFKNRAINLWNKLPQHVVNASSINSFKCQINKLPAKFYASYLFIK